jgi:hypothetical protein
MLGFNLSNSNFQSPLYTYMGGKTFISENEKVPICNICGEYMLQLLSLNQNALPLLGSMCSKGISRLFVCNSATCTSYQNLGSIQATLLQSTSKLTAVNSDLCSPIQLQEKAIYSQTVTSDKEDEYPLLVKRKADHTTVLFSPSLVGLDLKYMRKGQVFGIDNITLLDFPHQLTIAEISMSQRSSKREESPSPQLFRVVPTFQRERSVTPPRKTACRPTKREDTPPRKAVTRISQRERTVTPPRTCKAVTCYAKREDTPPHKKTVRSSQREVSVTPPRRGRKTRSSSSSPEITQRRKHSPEVTRRRQKSPLSPKKIVRSLSFSPISRTQKISNPPVKERVMFDSESEFSDTELTLAELMNSPIKTSILPRRAPPSFRKVGTAISDIKPSEENKTSFAALVKSAPIATDTVCKTATVPPPTKVIEKKKAPKKAVVVPDWVDVVDVKKQKYNEKKRVARENLEKYQASQKKDKDCTSRAPTPTKVNKELPLPVEEIVLSAEELAAIAARKKAKNAKKKQGRKAAKLANNAEETTLPNSTEETTLPDSTEETTLPDSTEETTLPDSTEETTLPDSTEETTLPDSTEDIEISVDDNEENKNETSV